jgi:hypothetical protein
LLLVYSIFVAPQNTHGWLALSSQNNYKSSTTPIEIFEMASSPFKQPSVPKPSRLKVFERRLKPSAALTRDLLKSLATAEAAWRTSPATIQVHTPHFLINHSALSPALSLLPFVFCHTFASFFVKLALTTGLKSWRRSRRS